MWLELLGGLAELFCSWRVYACVVPALFGMWILHESFPGAQWPNFVSIPLVIVAFVVGIRWEWKASP